MSDHVPVVEIITPYPEKGVVKGIMTTVLVDGEQWPIFSYHVEGAADDVQKITLTFLADVTIRRTEP